MNMVGVRVPLRVSFGGGGTDMDTYFRTRGGVVLSTTITRYGMVTCERTRAGVEVIAFNYAVSCAARQSEDLPQEGPFILARAALERLWQDAGGVRVSLGAEVAPGSGLGTSCALVVGLCQALLALQDVTPDPGHLAELAYSVDVEGAGQSSGKQDHYAAAFGGLNVIRFSGDGVTVDRAKLAADTVSKLEARTMLFFSGATRRSDSILAGQRTASSQPGAVRDALDSVKELAERMIRSLEAGDVDSFGALLGESWEHKKKFSAGVSIPEVDVAYAAALRGGALGGKLTGAGAGGHLLMQVPVACRAAVRDSLCTLGWQEVPVLFEPRGPIVLQTEG